MVYIMALCFTLVLLFHLDPLTVLLKLLKMEDVSLKMSIGFLSYGWRHLR